jgi:hypothetical protein
MRATALTGYRLANQHLAHQRLACPAEVVEWLGAVQAQDYAAAKWAIGQRLPLPQTLRLSKPSPKAPFFERT